MIEATIILRHNQFQVTGPPDLADWINALFRTAASGEAKHMVFITKLADYYVHCSVTGDKIPLSELKYWSVERQESYKTAAAGLVRYTEISTLP